MYSQTNSIKTLQQDEHLYNLYWKETVLCDILWFVIAVILFY